MQNVLYLVYIYINITFFDLSGYTFDLFIHRRNLIKIYIKSICINGYIIPCISCWECTLIP